MINPPPIQEKVANGFGVFNNVWARWLDTLRDFVNDIAVNTFDSMVIVKSAADLSGTLDSTKHYMIDGEIDMGNISIEVPEGGLSISGLNGGRDTSVLYSSENNYTMFTSPSGSYSGDFLCKSMTMYVTGTNSKLFDLDNDNNNGSFEVSGVNFGGFGSVYCTELGELTSYRQFFINFGGFYNVKDGLTFNGDWSGLVITDSNALGSDAYTLIKEGTALEFSGSIRSNANFGATSGSLNSSSVFMDFDEGNILSKGGLSLINFRTSVDDALPNIASSSSYVRFRNCDGIRNTYVGGQWYISSTATTTISTVSVPVKIEGNTTYSDLQWFTQTTDNALIYDGDQLIEIEVKGNLSFTGTNGDVINIYVRQWDDSASSYIDLSETAGSTFNSSGRAEGVAFNAIGALSNNDRVEIWVENDTAARNVTAQLNGYVVVSERAS